MEDNNWRKHFDKSKRGALLTIKNYTKNTLHRVSYSLDHGKWTLLPQDTIPAYSEVQFCSVNSSKGLTGTSGKVLYRLADNPAIKFEFVWDNPWMESRSAVYHLTGASERFTVEQTTNKRPQYEVTWAVEQPTNTGSPLSMSPLSRSSANMNVSKVLNEEDYAGLKLSLDDQFDLWKSEQINANRSVNFVIENESDIVFKRQSQSLNQGIWSKFPPEVIAGGSTVEFGCRSDTLVGGTSGRVTYAAPENVDVVTLTFDNPLDGDKAFDAWTKTPIFDVEIETDEDHNATVVYRIACISKEDYLEKLEEKQKLKRTGDSLDLSDSDGVTPRGSINKRLSTTNLNDKIAAQPPSDSISNMGVKALNLSSSALKRTNSKMPDLVHVPRTRIFGVPLKVIIERENSKTYIPLLVEKIVDHLVKYGIDDHQLFKKPGLLSEVKFLRNQFDANSKASLEFKNYSIHSLAHLLKMFLKELETPVIPLNLNVKYSSYILSHLSTTSKMPFSSFMSEFLTQIPELNLTLFHYLCKFFLLLVEKGKHEVESLANIFGPLLCKEKPSSDPNIPDLSLAVRRTLKEVIVNYRGISQFK